MKWKRCLAGLVAATPSLGACESNLAGSTAADGGADNRDRQELVATTPERKLTAMSSECSQSVIDEVTESATPEDSSVTIEDCYLNLPSNAFVTKRLLFVGDSASGGGVDCNGATLYGGVYGVNYGKDMIEVKSRRFTDSSGELSWERPHDVTIRECDIWGSVRVWGMGKNGEWSDVRASSRQDYSHRWRARNNAPRSVVLDDLYIVGQGRIPVYFSPGVSYSEIRNSEIAGSSASVAVYLDAESYKNTIEDNYIRTDTSREVMAIDGSSYNRIINNRFSGLSNGGIYLYRNCGEAGTIRISTPSDNDIINNVFYYDTYSGSNPAIYVGAREGDRPYCHKDDGFSYGSSISDLDHATDNAIFQNQIYERSVSDMIRYGARSSQSYRNHSGHNTTVTNPVSRDAGCFVDYYYDGYTNFVEDGDSLDVFKDADGHPTCTSYSYSCENSYLSFSSSSSCTLTKYEHNCQVTGTNEGCDSWFSCPYGSRIVGVHAACNLEWGTVSDNEADNVYGNSLEVVEASDHWPDGSCYVHNTEARTGTWTIDSSVLDRSYAYYGCSEHDANGGDCHIKAMVYCR